MNEATNKRPTRAEAALMIFRLLGMRIVATIVLVVLIIWAWRSPSNRAVVGFIALVFGLRVIYSLTQLIGRTGQRHSPGSPPPDDPNAQ